MGLSREVRRGVAWSAVNNIVLRAGSFAVGIALARLLTPTEFGVYAIALTVQTVLMTLADLGLSADLIRSDEPQRRAPTVGALGLATGGLLATVTALTSVPLAGALGSSDSAGVIAVLGVTLLLGGAGVVPYAMLLRQFRQRALFGLAAVDFAVSTAVTLVLVVQGWGPMSLALGRLVAQSIVLVLQFLVSGTKPKYAIDRAVARSVLRFGVPIAAANMLSLSLLSVDKVVIARLAGATPLGFYVLAFNVANWPMSAIGQVVRSVALPAFSRMPNVRNDPSLARGVALSWALALPAGAALAVLSGPLVVFVYGTRWEPAAPVLLALALFGALRVVFDLMVAYLLARGESRSVLLIQVIWIVALIPAIVVATSRFGIVGAGYAHLIVASLVVLPAYIVGVGRAGADLKALASTAWPPLLAAVPAAAAGRLAGDMVTSPGLTVLVGSVCGGLVYFALLARWLQRLLKNPPASEEQDLSQARPHGVDPVVGQAE